MTCRFPRLSFCYRFVLVCHTAVEIAPESYAGLRRNVPPHLQTSRQTTAAFLRDVRFRQALRHADVIVVDPPRAGLGDAVARGIAETQAKRIVYVSCNPETLHANLAGIAGVTHDVVRFAAFDQFPFTHHLEAAVYLVRKPL